MNPSMNKVPVSREPIRFDNFQMQRFSTSVKFNVEEQMKRLGRDLNDLNSSANVVFMPHNKTQNNNVEQMRRENEKNQPPPDPRQEAKPMLNQRLGESPNSLRNEQQPATFSERARHPATGGFKNNRSQRNQTRQTPSRNNQKFNQQPRKQMQPPPQHQNRQLLGSMNLNNYQQSLQYQNGQHQNMMNQDSYPQRMQNHYMQQTPQFQNMQPLRGYCQELQTMPILNQEMDNFSFAPQGVPAPSLLNQSMQSLLAPHQNMQQAVQQSFNQPTTQYPTIRRPPLFQEMQPSYTQQSYQPATQHEYSSLHQQIGYQQNIRTSSIYNAPQPERDIVYVPVIVIETPCSMAHSHIQNTNSEQNDVAPNHNTNNDSAQGRPVYPTPPISANQCQLPGPSRNSVVVETAPTPVVSANTVPNIAREEEVAEIEDDATIEIPEPAENAKTEIHTADKTEVSTVVTVVTNSDSVLNATVQGAEIDSSSFAAAANTEVGDNSETDIAPSPVQQKKIMQRSIGRSNRRQRKAEEIAAAIAKQEATNAMEAANSSASNSNVESTNKGNDGNEQNIHPELNTDVVPQVPNIDVQDPDSLPKNHPSSTQKNIPRKKRKNSGKRAENGPKTIPTIVITPPENMKKSNKNDIDSTPLVSIPRIAITDVDGYVVKQSVHFLETIDIKYYTIVTKMPKKIKESNNCIENKMKKDAGKAGIVEKKKKMSKKKKKKISQNTQQKGEKTTVAEESVTIKMEIEGTRETTQDTTETDKKEEGKLFIQPEMQKEVNPGIPNRNELPFPTTAEGSYVPKNLNPEERDRLLAEGLKDAKEHVQEIFKDQTKYLVGDLYKCALKCVLYRRVTLEHRPLALSFEMDEQKVSYNDASPGNIMRLIMAHLKTRTLKNWDSEVCRKKHNEYLQKKIEYYERTSNSNEESRILLTFFTTVSMCNMTGFVQDLDWMQFQNFGEEDTRIMDRAYFGMFHRFAILQACGQLISSLKVIQDTCQIMSSGLHDKYCTHFVFYILYQFSGRYLAHGEQVQGLSPLEKKMIEAALTSDVDALDFPSNTKIFLARMVKSLDKFEETVEVNLFRHFYSLLFKIRSIVIDADIYNFQHLFKTDPENCTLKRHRLILSLWFTHKVADHGISITPPLY